MLFITGFVRECASLAVSAVRTTRRIISNRPRLWHKSGIDMNPTNHVAGSPNVVESRNRCVLRFVNVEIN